KESGLTRERFAKGHDDFLAMYRRFWHCLAYAAERVVADHQDCIISFGAGHSHYEDPTLFARVRQALAPFANVILLMPSADVDKSIETLKARNRERGRPDWVFGGYDFVEHWVKDPCNHELATMTIYTDNKSAEQTCDEIVQRAGL